MRDLIELYDAGGITAQHLAVQALHMLDPTAPEQVLAPLPEEILAEIVTLARDYSPRGLATNYGPLPAADQVHAAVAWIHDHAHSPAE